ncbi:histidine kinase [uncultured Chitinophaga sp.]|uniref:sensor histidine kinase n=1 Tax=uncultured Chitinophaga sp. TaxID=339340 RepID=UPI0025CCBCD4|nr:histidine kinase [uncultured Chitinophaga sp.]
MPSISYIARWMPVYLLLALSSHAQGLFIRNYNVKDGLANATVYAAVQDRDGFIWFATPTGVSKFDGKRFRNYTKRDGLTDNDVIKLAADSRNRVWFFNYNGKLSFFGNHFVHNRENDSSLRFDSGGLYELENVFEDRARGLSFLNSVGRVVFYNGRSTLSDKWKGGPADKFFFLRNDSIYRPLQPFFRLSSLSELDKRTEKVYTTMPYPLQDIGFIERIRRNAVLTHKNVAYSYTYKDVVPFFNGRDFGIQEEISSICLDRDNLWIGTPRALYFIKDYFRGAKKASKLLNNHFITSILNDRDGNVWITTYGDGVYYIPYKNFYFSYLDNTNGLMSHSVFSVRKDKVDGSLYVGQNGGMLSRIDTFGRARQFNLDSTGGRNSVLSISPFKKDIMVGTDNNIFLIDRITQRVKLLQSIHMVKDIKVTPSGRIRVAADKKLITIEDGSSKTIALGEMAMAVVCLGDSAFYIGTNNGLYYGTDKKTPELANTTDVRLKQSIKDLEMIDGYLWVGTSDQGIYLVKNNQVLKQFTSQENLASDICQQLYYDGNGRLYVATNRGVSVIDTKAQALVRNITSTDGLMSDDIRDIHADGDTLLIATSNGLCYFNADNIPMDTIPPTIYLNAIRYGDSAYLPKANFTHLYESKGSFEVEFGAIAYDLPDLVDYQYNLSGDTLSWVTTKSNIIPFPDLQPGNYQLYIRARKFRSDWGPAVTLNINILPRWYQEWWARGILVLLGVLGILVILRFIVRRIKAAEKRKTEYNRRIAELEAKALTNQMNPHFIFNSLNSVQHLILEREEKQALNFLADFATLMRQMLNNSRKSFISLEDEIAFLTRYLELEKIRFASSFVYQFEIEEELKEYTVYIPPMLIQPILENAIKHGLAPKNGSGRLIVKMQLQNDLLYCAVDDDGIGWEQSNALKSNKLVKHESTAISVIKERLQIIKSFNGSIGKLEIIDKFKSGSGSKEGTLVVVRIPIVKML